MKSYTYILHSKKLSKFYIGATTINPKERLENHIVEYYGNSKFTAKTKDWVIFHIIECENIIQAKAIEKHIKNMKSKSYILNLSKYPEMNVKLIDRYTM